MKNVTATLEPKYSYETKTADLKFIDGVLYQKIRIFVCSDEFITGLEENHRWEKVEGQ